jgi:hypothetical protein
MLLSTRYVTAVVMPPSTCCQSVVRFRDPDDSLHVTPALAQRVLAMAAAKRTNGIGDAHTVMEQLCSELNAAWCVMDQYNLERSLPQGDEGTIASLFSPANLTRLKQRVQLLRQVSVHPLLCLQFRLQVQFLTWPCRCSTCLQSRSMEPNSVRL